MVNNLQTLRFAINVTVLSGECSLVERCRALVRCLHVNGGGSGASRTLSKVLCDSSLCGPLIATYDTVLALHILDDEDIVIVIEVSSSCRCLLPYTRMHRNEFVELCLGRKLALRLTGELRLLRKDVDVLPNRTFNQCEGLCVDG